MSKFIVCLIFMWTVTVAMQLNLNQIHRVRRSLSQQSASEQFARVKRQKENATASDEDYSASGELLSEELTDEQLLENNISFQLILGEANFWENGECFKKCVPLIEKLSRNASEVEPVTNGTSSELEVAQNATDFNRTEVELPRLPEVLPTAEFLAGGDFNETEFNELCADYIEAQECLDSCGPGYYTNLFAGNLRSLEYMCTVAKDDFIKYANCSIAANITTCESTCNVSSSVDDEISEGEGFTGAVKTMVELCGEAPCLIECTKPIIVAECDNEEKAGEVYEGITTHLIGGLVSSLEAATLDKVKAPETCQPIIDKAPLLPSQQSSQNTTETETETTE